MGKDVEEVAASLVREYLSRKGLKKTIACLDEELPRTTLSINNRSELRRILHLENLYKKNKSEEHPLKSMLEIMVKERMKKSGEAKICQLKDSQSFSAEQESSQMPDSVSATKDVSCVSRDRDLADSLRGNLSESENTVVSSATVAQGVERKVSIHDGQSTRSSRSRRGIMSGPVTVSTQETGRRRPARKSLGSYDLLSQPERDSDRMGWLSRNIGMDAGHVVSDRSAHSERESSAARSSNAHGTSIEGLEDQQRDRSSRSTSACSPRAGGLQVAEMVLDDIDDEEDLRGLSTVPISNTLPQRSLNNWPMDLQTATALKELIFGSPITCFSPEWRQQSFTFSVSPALRYGIVQKKGGPCGVLAAVQATVLQKLLFEGNSSGSESERLQVSDAVRTKCLAEAVVEILWRAGDRKKATVAINSGRRLFTPMGHYRSEGILEGITCIEAESIDDLKQLLEEHITQFEAGPFGCVLLVLSAVLSRTVEGTRDDMDMPSSSLIGAHSYCAQELVNLLLCGRAVSNVFDDEMKLDSGNGNFTLLKGIKDRCSVGLLSLFEHYNICKVGSFLKMPRFPIWVVCSESHFSVLFSLCEDLTSSRWKPRQFDLFYYDGLANQPEPIRLTVYPDSVVAAPDSRDVECDLVPPLELCIRTRWPNAVVSWNETEPIL